MEKLSNSEMRILNLIKSGKTKEDILSEKITTAGNLSYILSHIYQKTDYLVNYHTAKDKYSELVCYLRNNPEAFSIVPVNQNIKNKKEQKQKVQKAEESAANIINNVVYNMGIKYQHDINKTTVKLSMLEDFKIALQKELINER